MHVFNDRVVVFHVNVKLAEVPVVANTDGIKLIGNGLYCAARNTENSHDRLMCLIEGTKIGIGINLCAGDLCADDAVIRIKNTAKLKAGKVIGNMCCDRFTEITGTDQDAFMRTVYAKDSTDLSTQLMYGISVALLTVTAEAVEVLTDLGCCKTHLFRKFLGGHTQDTAAVKLLEKMVVAGQTTNDGH